MMLASRPLLNSAGVLRLQNGIQAVAAAQQHAADAVNTQTIATYQRMNIRNLLMILMVRPYEAQT